MSFLLPVLLRRDLSSHAVNKPCQPCQLWDAAGSLGTVFGEIFTVLLFLPLISLSCLSDSSDNASDAPLGSSQGVAGGGGGPDRGTPRPSCQQPARGTVVGQSSADDGASSLETTGQEGREIKPQNKTQYTSEMFPPKAAVWRYACLLHAAWLLQNRATLPSTTDKTHHSRYMPECSLSPLAEVYDKNWVWELNWGIVEGLDGSGSLGAKPGLWFNCSCSFQNDHKSANWFNWYTGRARDNESRPRVHCIAQCPGNDGRAPPTGQLTKQHHSKQSCFNNALLDSVSYLSRTAASGSRLVTHRAVNPLGTNPGSEPACYPAV